MGTENGVITRLPFHGVDTALGHVLPRAVSVITGGVLLTAAAGEALQLTHSPLPSPGLEGLPGFAPALIAWEIFLGLWLFSGVFPAAARKLTTGCFSIFACYAIYEAAIGRTDCGCFGQVHVNPWFTMVLDVAVVLALVFLAKPAAKSAVPPSRWASRKWPVVLAMVIGLTVGITSAMFHPKLSSAANGLATGDGGKLVIMEPHKWIGHRLPLLRHIVSLGSGKHLGRQLAHGQWVVIFYHASCDECRTAIPIYEALAAYDAGSGSATRIAFIRVPSGPPTPAPPGLFHANTAIHGTLDTTHEWFATTPIAVKLSSGKVIAVATGTSVMNLNWVK